MADTDPQSHDAVSAPDTNMNLVRQSVASGGSDKDAPEIDESQKALVAEWQKKILARRGMFEKDFTKMRENMELARYGAKKDHQGYVVPLIARHINQKVASLYARKPTVSAEVRRKVLFKVWDEDPETFKAAAMEVMQATQMQQPPDPNAMAILQEVEQVKQEDLMMRRMAKTAEIVADYFISPRAFKRRMKQMVRRACITKVGYVDLSFQREMKPDPAVTAQIDSHLSQINRLEQLSKEAQEDEIEDPSARLAELRNLVESLKAAPQIITREGPVFDFPRSKEIIVGEGCVQLHGFDGASWIAREFHRTEDQVETLWGVELGGKYTPYYKGKSTQSDSAKPGDPAGGAKGDVCVWRVQDKANGQEFFIADGYEGWIKAPAEPDMLLDRFFTTFSYVVNDVEDDEDLYPPSDVEWMESAQKEMNYIRQALADHRRASVPGWVASSGAMDTQEKVDVLHRVSHGITTLKQFQPGTKLKEIFDAFPTAPVDPNLYADKPVMDDVQRSVGSQDANFGAPQSNTTATTSSIAENSRISANGSNIDDLDDLLSELMESVHEANLLYLSPQTVAKIAGINAMWPDQLKSRIEAVEKLGLRVQAGSSGRLNAAATLANMERAAPFLERMPGINIIPFARRYFEVLELPVDEMTAEGAPSSTAMNAIAAKVPPAANPAQGGGAPQPGAGPQQQGPQPAHPAPGAGVPGGPGAGLHRQ